MNPTKAGKSKKSAFKKLSPSEYLLLLPTHKRGLATAKEHIILGLVVLTALWILNVHYRVLPLPVEGRDLIIFQLIIICIIYSQMPDIDQPGSKINRYFTLVLLGVILLAFFQPSFKKFGIIAVVVLGMLRFVGHREVIHSVLGALLVSFPLAYLGVVQFIVGFIAFIVHIIADKEFSWGFEKENWN